jgi:hypothetical protein
MTRLLKLILLSLPVFVSCEREPRLSALQYPSQFSPYQRVSAIPIILVGRIIANSKIGQSQSEKQDHSRFIRQLFRLTIAVENVLKGNVALGNIEVYYFTNLGPIGEHPDLECKGKSQEAVGESVIALVLSTARFRGDPHPLRCLGCFVFCQSLGERIRIFDWILAQKSE